MFSFFKSHKYLDKIGFPRLEDYEKNTIIKNIDFAEAREKGKIEYRDDGVYLNYNGKWIRGYYYMSSYNIDSYGNPRFHLFNCSTMQNKHLYKGKYIWSNAETVDVKNRQNNYEWEKDLILPLCSNCRKIINNSIIDTEDFYASTENNDLDIKDFVQDINPTQETNIYGYPTNWKEIASKFKQQNGLKCNSCGLSDESGHNQWFYDVDHRNGIKSDCSNRNLQVLCKLCHTYKDKHHKEQALKYPHRSEILHELVRIKQSELKSVNNRFLDNYLADFDTFLNN
ncbi:hypothetical protein [uncultured Salegentibacter sp.]|uniref:hypothetical protein n=1 Tax=uncultured Salegentibacter sp. TaxID=259320 RepID=UPI00259517DA|nr:hypothetical protein [uncultured Salegentibacter sp.]